MKYKWFSYNKPRPQKSLKAVITNLQAKEISKTSNEIPLNTVITEDGNSFFNFDLVSENDSVMQPQ